MKKIFTLLGGLLLTSCLTVNAEKVTVYISDKDGNDIAQDYVADLTKDADGVYTLANLFQTSESSIDVPISFKFSKPEIGKYSPIEVTSSISPVEGYDGYYYIKNSNNKYPIFWIYDLNGIDDWVRLRYSFIYLGEDGSSVYRYDTSDSDNEYEYVATMMISGTFNGKNPETEAYDKELFTGEGEEDPWLYVEFWFNDPQTDDPIEEPTVEVLKTIDVTVDFDEAYYYPDYNDEDNYSEIALKPFDAQLEFLSDGTYTLKNIFGTDYSISYSVSNFNPKNVAKVTFIGNIKTDEGYEAYPYFRTPNNKYMTVQVEGEDGNKMSVDYLSGYVSTDYTYIYKCTEEEIAEGYDQYYVYLNVSGYVGDTASLDMTLVFGYNDTITGVANIEASENAPIEYYNLQGVKVTDPSNGIFIRRQGNKISKITVK